MAASCAGMVDEDGPDISVMYWLHMKEVGLVDILLDDEVMLIETLTSLEI